MKKKWVAFFLCLFLGPFGAHKFYEGKVGMGVLYLFTFGLAAVGWIVDIFVILSKPGPLYDPKAKRAAPASSSRPAPPPVARPGAQAPAAGRPAPAVRVTVETRGGSSGEYDYHNVDVCILRGTDPDLSDVAVGDAVELVPEPENEADDHAVAVYIGGDRVGYLFRGRLKNMVWDFLARDSDVEAEVSAVGEDWVKLDLHLVR